MAVERPGHTITLPASGDLSGDQYKFIQVDSAGRAFVATSSDTPVIGVLQNRPDAIDKAATIWGIGSISKVVAAGVLFPGTAIRTQPDGIANVEVQPNFIVGTCLSVSSDPGDLVSIFITQPGRSVFP